MAKQRPDNRPARARYKAENHREINKRKRMAKHAKRYSPKI